MQSFIFYLHAQWMPKDGDLSLYLSCCMTDPCKGSYSVCNLTPCCSYTPTFPPLHTCTGQTHTYTACFPLICWGWDRCKQSAAVMADLASPPVRVSRHCHFYTVQYSHPARKRGSSQWTVRKRDTQCKLVTLKSVFWVLTSWPSVGKVHIQPLSQLHKLTGPRWAASAKSYQDYSHACSSVRLYSGTAMLWAER